MRVTFIAGWSSPVARQAHNLKVGGSNPLPATNITFAYHRYAKVAPSAAVIRRKCWRGFYTKDAHMDIVTVLIIVLLVVVIVRFAR